MNDITFGRPTQVIFWDYFQKCYGRGIAFNNEVICGCCGYSFPIKNILADAKRNNKKDYEAIIPLPWANISDAIAKEYNT